MPKLLPLEHPEDWRMDDTGSVLVHRVVMGKDSTIYTLYQIKRVTWGTSIKACFRTLAAWMGKDSTGPPEERVA